MRDLIPYKNSPDGHSIRRAVLAGIIFTAAVVLMCAACAITYAIARFTSGDASAVNAVSERVALPMIVIDAGHGGIDGGAVGADGSLEKEINLAVAKKLASLCNLSGIDCVLTRNDDRMLVDDSVTSRRKMHDLKNRLAVVDGLCESGRDVIFVSIHMNNFPSPKYSGLQVWYSKNNSLSSELAAYVQSYARTWLDTSNTRQTKAATSAIYLLDRATVPAILVECGFLSNPDECARLGSDEYRTKLAVTIYAAVCDYLKNEG